MKKMFINYKTSFPSIPKHLKLIFWHIYHLRIVLGLSYLGCISCIISKILMGN